MSRLRRRSLSVPSAFALFALLAPPVLAQGFKLSGELARPIGGDVITYALSPDGKRVVYVADQETDDVLELFCAKPNVAGAVVKLAGPRSGGGEVSALWIGPRGQRVVFGGDLDTQYTNELYSVPIDGGPVVKLNAPLVSQGDVDLHPDSVQIDASETRVVYLADQDRDRVQELFSVPITGGTAIKLNSPLAGMHVSSFRISPDGTQVVYLADQEQFGVDELYSVPITGGPAVKLSPPGILKVAAGFAIDARSARAVFVADVATGKRQLFSASLRGSGAALALLLQPVRSAVGLQLSADGARVVCTVAELGAQAAELTSAPIDGHSSAVTLYALASATQRFAVVELAPDARSVLFAAGQNAGAFQLFRAPIDGSSAAVVLAPAADRPDLQFSPDGADVLFEGDGLFRARIDGSTAPVRLADRGFAPTFTPDGARVVYLSSTGNSVELYSVPSAGGQLPLQLNGPLPFGGNVGRSVAGSQPFLVSPLGGRVVYLADQNADEQFELFSVPEDGRAAPVRINRDLPIGPVEGDVYDLALASDGAHAVYLADAETNDQTELFSVRTDGRAAPLRLHGPLAPGEYAYEFEISPDATRVVYLLEKLAQNEQELLVAPIGGGPSIHLNGTSPAVYSQLLIDATSTRAVFLGYLAGAADLFSVPLDGSSPPVMLNTPQPPGSGVSGSQLTITPDGRRVLYLSDPDGGYDYELFSVPIDASASPIRLDGTLVPGGRVQKLVLSPDGSRAVYVADSFVLQRYELFSVPVDGSASAIRLSPPLGSFNSVSPWQLSAAGDSVFYRAYQDSASKAELYRVPLDGSAPTVKISAPLVNGGNVMFFRVTPDGSRAVYQADQEVDERFEIYSAPGQGGGPVLKLNGPLGNGDVSGDGFADMFEDVLVLSPDGTQVVFGADPDVRGTRELFRAPIDGSAPAVMLSAPLHAGDTVLPGFRFTVDGRGLVYLASERDLGAALFLVALDSPGKAKRLSGFGFTPIYADEPVFDLTPDGERIVFQTDQETKGVNEAFFNYLVRPDGRSATPTKSVTVVH